MSQDLTSLVTQTGETIKSFQAKVDSLEQRLDDREEKIAKLIKEDNRKALMGGGGRNENPRSYKNLFYHKGGDGPSNDGWTSWSEFYTSCRNKLGDPRIVKASYAEDEPSLGGFLVPEEYSAELLDVSLESEIVRPRARVVPMISKTRHVPGVTLGDHSQNLFGGLIGYSQAEGSALQESEATFFDLELIAKKLVIFGKSSTEVYEDGTNMPQTISKLFSSGLGWYMDKQFLRGTGTGESLGILASNCLITVTKEATQAADTVLFKNLAKMVGRLHPGCWANSVWICNPSVLPQLMILGTQTADTGSGLVLGMSANAFDQKSQTLFTRPLIVSEKMSTLGDVGDIGLFDLSQYTIGIRRGIRLETSTDQYFSSDQLAHRCIVRFDGMPSWPSTMTLQDGVNTVSPFVVIEAR